MPAPTRRRRPDESKLIGGRRRGSGPRVGEVGGSVVYPPDSYPERVFISKIQDMLHTCPTFGRESRNSFMIHALHTFMLNQLHESCDLTQRVGSTKTYENRGFRKPC